MSVGLRENPYRLFFPLGLLAGWLGVSHWFLYGFGYIPAYSGLGHALVMTQAMLGAFALGFLMTAVPRRTESPPASWLEIALGAGAVAVVAIAADRDAFVTAEYGYVALMSVLLVFLVRRTESGVAGRRPPNAFIVLPVGCAGGIAGGVLIARMVQGQGSLEAYLVGRELVQQGVFLCFVVGVGALLLRLIQGDTPPADAEPSRRSRLARLGYFAAAVAILGTLVADPWYPRTATAARAVLVAGALLWGGVGRWPRKPGLHRRVATVAAWLVPAGLALAVVFPQHAVAALHVMFIGGFSLLVFAASAHVSLGHGRRPQLMTKNSLRVLALAALVLAATALRGTAHLWPERYYELIAVAATLWLAGSAAWLALVARDLR